MRWLPAFGAALALSAIASRASALGVCDPQAHFCFTLDTEGARVCDLMQKGELDPASCDADDAELRDGIRHAAMPPVQALRVRREDTQIYVTVVKHPAAQELEQEDLDRHAIQVRAAMEHAAGPIEVFAPPVVSRVHGVETVQFERQWHDGDDKLHEIDVEVFAQDGLYMVSFQGLASDRLKSFAERTMATLDASPVVPSVRSGALVTWAVRALIVVALVALIVRWRARGKAPAKT